MKEEHKSHKHHEMMKKHEKHMKEHEKHMKEHKKFIQHAINPEHKGALRRKLHVKEGHDIPEAKLKKAEHSKNSTTRKQAVLAETLKKFHPHVLHEVKFRRKK